MSRGTVIPQTAAASQRPTTRNKERIMTEPSPSRLPLGPILIASIAFRGLPFVPLLLSGIEYLTLRTNRVEDVFRQIGIHDELSAFYDSVGKLFRF